MITWHEELLFDFTTPIINRYFTEDTFFFDIETTGFSPERTSLYLIGCAARREDKLILDQFFAESPEEEAAVLSAFMGQLAHYQTVITFNGLGFDVPYLKAKCSQYGLTDSFDEHSHLDLFKEVSHLKFLLKLPNYKQKTVESFLGIGREDVFHGGELISVYQEYVKNPSDEALSLLRLHNYEDVLDMPKLLSVLSYRDVLFGHFSIAHVEGNEYLTSDHTSAKELFINLKLDDTLPNRVSCGCDDFYISAAKDSLCLRIRLFEGELRYFFPNYSDYSYLPDEDIAVHKSVSSYVDKEHRKKATADTCYIKKQAIYLPQYERVCEPAFQENRKDKKSYFELTEDFIKSEKLLREYILHIFKYLSVRRKSD